ncbi:MAG: hypothetical protein IT423_02495 [Pirellulaceae bacterium]|nr:hypothetical protein [Pirellulaceae bacterium]
MSHHLQPGSYQSYKGLPALAGLSTIDEAAASQWSVEESVKRLKRLHYVLKRLHETFTERITSEPIYELKMALSHHAYLCAEQVTLIRSRVSEMREPPLGLDKVPHPGLERLMDEVRASRTTANLLLSVYELLLPAILSACDRLRTQAHPLADAPTVRVARLIHFELSDVQQYGQQAIACLVTQEDRVSAEQWLCALEKCMKAAGQLDATEPAEGEVPAPLESSQPYVYQGQPQRDERFQDPFNAGVNPEAFLYDESFPARAKTLMMYYKRIREIDVPEMMASILHDLRDAEPWEFHAEMSRQLWDEARHAMMGEVGFVSQGLDWRNIPINFTWSRNLNTQLDARERHGVLFFIEQGLMPRSGKRYEWEVGLASGDALSGLFQDFDWADEVLHAQIGRRWYVPRYKSLQEALAYGDRCWTKVVSHWRDYLDRGLTQHQNWWPELYRHACQNWGVTPDAAVLAYNKTYEDSRADLQKLT